MGNNTNKLILLVVAGIALLLALNIYQKQIGKNVAVVLSIVTIVVVGYVAFQLVSQNNLVNNVPLNNAPLNNAPLNNAPLNNLQAPVDIDDEELENVLNMNVENAAANNPPPNNALANNAAPNNVVVNNDTDEEDVVEGFDGHGGGNKNSPVNNGVFTCSDLLPGDTNSTWSQVSPSGVGSLCDKNLLNAGHHVGVNTKGTSLRNANRGLRSEPPNPQVRVSPWLQTTIAPDLLRRPLEG